MPQEKCSDAMGINKEVESLYHSTHLLVQKVKTDVPLAIYPFTNFSQPRSSHSSLPTFSNDSGIDFRASI